MKYIYVIFVLGLFSFQQKQTINTPEVLEFEEETYQLDSVRLRNKVREALRFAKTKNMNQSFGILVDMKIHSGRSRFFVYDFKGEIVLNVCYVTCPGLPNN